MTILFVLYFLGFVFLSMVSKDGSLILLGNALLCVSNERGENIIVTSSSFVFTKENMYFCTWLVKPVVYPSCIVVACQVLSFTCIISSFTLGAMNVTNRHLVFITIIFGVVVTLSSSFQI